MNQPLFAILSTTYTKHDKGRVHIEHLAVCDIDTPPFTLSSPQHDSVSYTVKQELKTTDYNQGVELEY